MFVFIQDQVKVLEICYPLSIIWQQIGNVMVYDSWLQIVIKVEETDTLF